MENFCHHAFTAVAAICAKERSGVHAVEEAVKSVIGSVYEKFHLVPDELVRIANRNPDLSGAAVHRPTPPPKTTAFGIAGAVYAECELAAKELYERYEGKAEQCAVAAAVPSGAEGGILDGEVQQESCGSGGERL
ncbi:REF/SRPP-like protein At3g05500 [Glycine max]|uniref:REF/SRPP-like protein At3g05500 n=1 Tax=Glycine max TaxID=3847 RepID=UPI000719304D|nr:REF/SRPP-like protein At3g05500 [Glycine max]|eukprot:XP_014633000.1 REF/SRPP-like protein At3g05500 [Glycine max]